MTNIGDQYPIIDTGAGWHQRADRGLVRVEGNDRTSFLQALLTNDLSALSATQGLYAAYLTPQGRMICDMWLYQRPQSVLLDVPASVVTAVVSKLDALIFSEDVRVIDATAAVSRLTVCGRTASLLLDKAIDFHVRVPTWPLGVAESAAVFAVRSDEFGVSGLDLDAFDLFVPSELTPSTIDRLQSSGVENIGSEVLDWLRIEAGRPAFGRDMDEHTIPLEAGLLDRAISLTKGCYVGQEVIVRVLHRGAGRVAKRLVKLAFDADLETPPAPGTSLHIDGRESGRITSSARSPRLGRVVALGYLAREDADVARASAATIDGREWRAEVLGLAG